MSLFYELYLVKKMMINHAAGKSFCSATGNSVDHYGNTNCIAHEDGNVLWVPPSIFHVFCELDFRKWPFDTQVCSMKIGSWSYDGQQIDLRYSQHDPEVGKVLLYSISNN